MTLLNSQPLVGYKHGDFVKFKYNTIVYHQEKGLPMFRDVEQYGWLNNPNVINGRVHVQPVGSVHHGHHLRVDAAKVIDKHTYDKNHVYTKAAPQGFQVERPQFDADPDVPTYAGGDIPLPRNAQVTARKTAAQIKRGVKKAAKASGRKYEVRYKKTKDLDAEIQRQKDLINGKVSG